MRLYMSRICVGRLLMLVYIVRLMTIWLSKLGGRDITNTTIKPPTLLWLPQTND